MIAVLTFLCLLFGGTAVVYSYTVAVDGAVVVLLIALVLTAISLARRLPPLGGPR